MSSDRPSNVLTATLFLVLLGTTPCAAQLLPFTYYTPREGLVSNGIHALCQDSRGYLWIGTSEGLSVFDGDTFVNYRTNEGLALNFVTSIIESRKAPGTIWIATLGGGVSKYVAGMWNTIHLDPKKPADEVMKIVEDRSGTLWCSTTGGLYALREDQPSKISVEDGVEPVTEIAETPDRNLWIGFGSSLAIFDSTRASHRTFSLRGFARGIVEKILTDADSSVWIGTSDGYLLHFHDTTLLGTRAVGRFGLADITDDGHGDLWLCTGSGLFRIAKANFLTSRFLHYTTENGLPRNEVSTCLFDRENNLWIGGSGQGLSKWTDRTTLSFPLRPPPEGFMYHPAAAQDARGHLWAISADGVWEFWRESEEQWKSELHNLRSVHGTSQVTWIQFDPLGTMWIGFNDGTTFSMRISQETDHASKISGVKLFRTDISGPAAKFSYLVIDRRGNLWLSAAAYGVSVVDRSGKLLRRYTTADGLPSNDVRDICQGRDGAIWLAGVEGGITVIPGEGFDIAHARRITMSDSLPDDRIRALMEDKEGRMWVGTRHGGVARLDGGKIRTASMRDGLISNTVWWLSEDDSGCIWLGTQMGMQRIAKDSMKLFPLVNDLLGDGIICCGVSRDFIVWSYQPRRFTIHEHHGGAQVSVPPLVNITKFQVNGADVDIGERREFRYDENLCTIEYIGISFKDEKEVRYQYRLLGAGPEWHQPTDHHAVTFATLNPGSYVFEVRAISGEGMYSQSSASLAFTIVPPFWQRWWFHLVGVACVIGILAVLYRYRMAKVLEMERTRNKIARDLHDEVGGTLSSISYFAEALRTDANEKGMNIPQHFLSLITESASSAKAAMGDIAWSLDPSNDNWEKLLSKMRRYAVDLLEAKSIRHKISIVPPANHTELRMEPRQNLWLLYKEILVNAVKHSACSEIIITLSVKDSILRLAIEDNGIGFDSLSLSEGRGINNIRERASLLKASCVLHTSPGGGTRWEIDCPL